MMRLSIREQAAHFMRWRKLQSRQGRYSRATRDRWEAGAYERTVRVLPVDYAVESGDRRVLSILSDFAADEE